MPREAPRKSSKRSSLSSSSSSEYESSDESPTAPSVTRKSIKQSKVSATSPAKKKSSTDNPPRSSRLLSVFDPTMKKTPAPAPNKTPAPAPNKTTTPASSGANKGMTPVADTASIALSTGMPRRQSLPATKKARKSQTTWPANQHMAGSVVLYTTIGLGETPEYKELLRAAHLPFEEVRLDVYPEFKDQVFKEANSKDLPMLFFNSTKINGVGHLRRLLRDKQSFEPFKCILLKKAAPDFPVVPQKKANSLNTSDDFNPMDKDGVVSIQMNMLRLNGILRGRGCLCFKASHHGVVGQEFVQFIVQSYGVDSSVAIALGQRLIDKRALADNKKMNRFTNDNRVFTLLNYDERKALNNNVNHITEMPKTTPALCAAFRKALQRIYGSFLSPDGQQVDYLGVESSDAYLAYQDIVTEFIEMDLGALSREECISFFINVYNAMVIHIVIARGSHGSGLSRKKFFKGIKYMIGGYAFSLEDIEHGVLRGNRRLPGGMAKPFSRTDARMNVVVQSPEPKVEFALMRATKSCPSIRMYEPGRVLEQLTLAVKQYVECDRGVALDSVNRQISLSAIFKWHMTDFGGTKEAVLDFILDHMSNGQKKDHLKLMIESKRYKIKFMHYDWSLNAMEML